jgi:hypothetical protein
MKGSIFLTSITAVLFIISTLFLAINVADLIICLQMTLNPDTIHTLGDKVTMAGLRTNGLEWMIPLTFVFGVCDLSIALLLSKRDAY